MFGIFVFLFVSLSLFIFEFLFVFVFVFVTIFVFEFANSIKISGWYICSSRNMEQGLTYGVSMKYETAVGG